MVYLILFAGLILMDVLTDVLWCKNKKFVSKIVENVYKGLLMAILLFYAGVRPNIIMSIEVVYWCLHFTLFDPAFNLMAKLNINYAGTTSGAYGDLINKLGWKSWLFRGISLGIAVYIFIDSILVSL